MNVRSILIHALLLLVTFSSLALAQPQTVIFRGLQISATGEASLDVTSGGSMLFVAGPTTPAPFGLAVNLAHAQGGGLGSFAFDPAGLPAGQVTFTASTSPPLPVTPELVLQWDGAQWTCSGDQSGAGTDGVDLDYYLDDVLVASQQVPHGELYGQALIPPSAAGARIAYGLLGPGDLVSLLAWRIDFPGAVDCILADRTVLLVDRIEARPATDPLMLATKEMQAMNMSFAFSTASPPFSLGDAWMMARSHELRGVGQATLEAVAGGDPCDDCVRIDNFGSSGLDGAQAALHPDEFAMTGVMPWTAAPIGTTVVVEAYGEVDGVSGLRVGRVEVEQAVGERIMRPDFGLDVKFTLELRLASEIVMRVVDHEGIVHLPEVDDEVLVEFESGDVNAPYVIGRLYNGSEQPPGSMQPEGEPAVIADELVVYPQSVPAPSRLEFLRLLGVPTRPLIVSGLAGRLRGEPSAGWTSASALGTASLVRQGDNLLFDPPAGAASAGARVDLEPTNGWMLAAGQLAAPYIPGGSVVSAAVSRRQGPEQKWSSAMRVNPSLRIEASANTGSLAGATLELWVWHDGLPVVGPIAVADDEPTLSLAQLPICTWIAADGAVHRIVWSLRKDSLVEPLSFPGISLAASDIEFRATTSAKASVGPNDLAALELHAKDFGPLLLHDLGMQVPTAAVPIAGPTLISSAWPNPITGEQGRLAFRLAQTGRVHIELFDLRGRRLGTLLDQPLEVGAHTWGFEARDGRGERLASGTYFLRVTADGVTETRRFVLVR